MSFGKLILTPGTQSLTLTPGTQRLELGFTVTGETNTISNVGGGIGVHKQKVGVNHELYSFEAGDNIGIALNPTTNRIVFTGEGSGLQTPLNIPVDFQNSTTDPPPNNRFTSQAEVDAYLASQGATSFQHVNELVAALPTIINHPVAMFMATGVHRPSSATAFQAAFDLSQKLIVPDGSIAMVGQPPSAYTTVAGPFTVQSHIVGNFDPSMTFLGTPFAGQNHHPLYARANNGYVGKIHFHDGSTLKLTTNLFPAPTDLVTQVDIVRPSTILRNSRDDITRAYPDECVKLANATTSAAAASATALQDLQIDAFGSRWAVRASEWHGVVIRIVVDHEFQRLSFGIAPAGRDFQLDGFTGLGSLLLDCGFVADQANVGTRGNPIVSGTTFGVFVSGCYVAHANGPIDAAFNGSFGVENSVFEGLGGSRGLVVIEDTSFVSLNESGFFPGVRTTFKNSTSGGPGLHLRSNSRTLRSDLQGAQFQGIDGPCILAEDNAWFDLSTSIVGMKDASGNNDVGIEFKGHGSFARLNAGTDVTGAAGDFKTMDSPPPISYADLATAGAFEDSWKNVIRI